MAQCFSRTEIKYLLNQTSKSSENIFQEFRENKTFPNKGKVRECVASKLILKEWLRKFSKKKGDNKRKKFKISGRKKMIRAKIQVNTKFTPLCSLNNALSLKERIQSNVIFNICRENM